MVTAPDRSDGRPGLADYGLLGLLACIWGASFMLLKISVAEIPPVTLNAARQAIAMTILVVASFATGHRLMANRSDHLVIILSAVFGIALPFTLITWGVQEINAGLAAILMGAMPLMTIVLAHFVTDDEKMSVPKLVGVLFGIAGLLVLFWPDLVDGTNGNIWRQLAVMAAGFSYALNALLTKKLLHLRVGPMFSVNIAWSFGMLAVAAVIFEPLPTKIPSAEALIALLLLGIFPSAIASLMMFRIIARQGASFFGQINLLVPAVGVFWASIILHERLPVHSFIAMSIIILGVAVARLHTRRKPLPIVESTS